MDVAAMTEQYLHQGPTINMDEGPLDLTVRHTAETDLPDLLRLVSTRRTTQRRPAIPFREPNLLLHCQERDR